ncbi:MAG: hypothetical protein CL450_04265 [Acidimicrobiaceae bacterium]|nr:hypothetical protein [Acidimicrobiaceae bacterium]
MNTVNKESPFCEMTLALYLNAFFPPLVKPNNSFVIMGNVYFMYKRLLPLESVLPSGKFIIDSDSDSSPFSLVYRIDGAAPQTLLLTFA